MVYHPHTHIFRVDNVGTYICFLNNIPLENLNTFKQIFVENHYIFGKGVMNSSNAMKLLGVLILKIKETLGNESPP